MSIICRDCGFENEDGDEWCGDCRAYIAVGYKGQVAQSQAAAPVESEPADPGPDRFARVKEALSVDERSLQAEDDERARVAAEDARLAARVVAEREAAEAAAAARAAEEEAARRIEATRRQQEEAAAAAARAAAELEDLRRRQEEQAAAARRAVEEAAARAEEERVERIRRAEEQARRDAEEAARRRAEELAGQERAAEAARQAAAERAEAARQAELTAERERVEAQRRVQEAAAAAAAAALRAAEEHDAIAAAQAAKEASEAQAAQARAEAAAAAAAAAEEVARARAEAEAARAEAAALRSQAEAEAARSERERTEARAAQLAAEEAEAARRRAEEDEAAQRRRAEAEAEAARVRAEAEADAAQKRAEAELEARELEAKAATARAEAEAARAAKEAAEREIDRKKRLEEAARLVHQAPPAGAAAGAGAGPGGARPGSGAGRDGAAGRDAKDGAAGKAGRDAKSDKAGKDGTEAAAASVATGPEARQPKLGEQAPQEQQRRARAQTTTTRGEINPGDLVCGSCGTGNVATRKFCRRCGTPLADAKPAKLGFFARWKAKRRLKRQRKAGERPGRNGGRGGMGGASAGGRVAWFKLNTVLVRAGALLGVLAVLGFGVEPIRSRLQLPNVRQKVIDAIRGAKPVYDPVRPVSAAASSSAPGGEAGRLIDLGNNTAWLAAPSANGGVGSTVTVTFAKPFDLARVLLTSGLQGSSEPGKGFVSQPRPSELRLVFDGDAANPVVLPVKDTEKPQQLAVKRSQVTTVRFEVTGVYPASDGQGSSVAITELEFFERRKLGDDYETLTAPKFFVSSSQNASALSDDRLDTAWISDPAASGVNQGFDIRFDQPTDVARIRIAAGQAEATFSSAPRPDDVQLAITCQGRCDPTRQIELKDEPGFQTFNLNATGVTEIKLLVRSVHGSGNGVAFAEVQVQRKRPKVT